jgi:hypothetical protein
MFSCADIDVSPLANLRFLQPVDDMSMMPLRGLRRIDRRTKMERFVGVLAVFFWVAATLFVALLFTAGLSYDFVVGLLGSKRLKTVNAVLLGTVAVCSGLIGEAAQHLPEGLGLDLNDT